MKTKIGNNLPINRVLRTAIIPYFTQIGYDVLMVSKKGPVDERGKFTYNKYNIPFYVLLKNKYNQLREAVFIYNVFNAHRWYDCELTELWQEYRAIHIKHLHRFMHLILNNYVVIAPPMDIHYKPYQLQENYEKTNYLNELTIPIHLQEFLRSD